MQPKSSKSIFGKTHFFDPFLTDFWSQNSSFSRHFVSLEWPKWLVMGSKRAHFTCLRTSNGLGSFLGKHIFDPFLTHFWSQNNPFSRHFVALEGPKWLAMGSKWAHFTCLGTPNDLGSILEKHIFDPFLTHFLSQNSPLSRHFGLSRGPKRATTSSKRAKNTCFGIPCGPRSFLKKVIFFCTRWTLLTHFGAHLFGLRLAACCGLVGSGTGV